jgi:hypothetical protein
MRFINSVLLIWVVFTTTDAKELEKKLNELLSFNVLNESYTKILQSGNIPNYTIIYWKIGH